MIQYYYQTKLHSFEKNYFVDFPSVLIKHIHFSEYLIVVLTSTEIKNDATFSNR